MKVPKFKGSTRFAYAESVMDKNNSILLIFEFIRNAMKKRANYLFVLFFSVLFVNATAQQKSFDKPAFYQVMEKAGSEELDNEIKLIAGTTGINKDAYTGALLMKKASLEKGAAKKLNVFKQGHEKLEAVIKKDQQNAEWRFLRLIIQENAPKILKYRSEIKTDAAYIQSSFKGLSADVQSAVMDYRKHSNTLQALNF